MALPADFSKIFGSTATGGLTPIGDVNYAKGWEFVGATPPTKNDFSYLQNLSDRKSQWLYSNKLQRTNPFGDIKSDGTAAVEAARSNLDLGTAATKDVGTTSGTVAEGDDPRIVNAVQKSSPAICTAWVNFSGVSPVTIRSSFNVSSVTRLSEGKYQINFASPMNNSGYAVALAFGDGTPLGSASPVIMMNNPSANGTPLKTTNSVTVLFRNGNGNYDSGEANAIFFGGK